MSQNEEHRPVDWLRPVRRAPRARRLLLFAWLLLLPLATGGCFLRTLAGYTDDGGRAHSSANVEVRDCGVDHATGLVSCTYEILDSDGDFVEKVSTFNLLTQLGVLGVVIDPLVLQVPAEASDLVGTYDDAGGDRPLVITRTDTFPVQPGQVITAEPGTTFAILELPDEVAEAVGPDGQEFAFRFELSLPPGVPTAVKPMLTARVDHEGTRYYPPVFPCVTDFAAIPSVEIPFGVEGQDLRAGLAPIIDRAAEFACDNVVYDFRSPAPPPNRPPDCSSVESNWAELWPPNHELREVTIAGATDPDDDPVTLTIGGVTQDEPVDGSGDGDTAPDAASGPSGDRILLRAERSGAGDGRVYRIAFTGDDGKGSTCTDVARVGVPHSHAQPAVESAEVYDSLGG